MAAFLLLSYTIQGPSPRSGSGSLAPAGPACAPVGEYVRNTDHAIQINFARFTLPQFYQIPPAFDEPVFGRTMAGQGACLWAGCVAANTSRPSVALAGATAEVKVAAIPVVSVALVCLFITHSRSSFFSGLFF